MEYRTKHDYGFYGNIKTAYESSRASYDKFMKRSREIAQSLLGDYNSDGSSAEYMKRMPPKDNRVQEYFSA